MANISDFLVICIPTPDEKTDIYSMDTVYTVADIMKKSKIIVSSNKFGVLNARNVIVEKLKNTMNELKIEHSDIVRLLWLDSDIRIITKAEDVAKELMFADRMHLNIVANYHALWTENKIVSTIEKPIDDGVYQTLSQEELDKFKKEPYLPRGYVAGLGFYYGDFDINYKFELNKYGEDVNFYRYMYDKYPDYKLTLSNIELKHIKLVPI